MIIKACRNAFLSGFLILLPLGVTSLIISTLLSEMGINARTARLLLDDIGRPISSLIRPFIPEAVKISQWTQFCIDLLGLFTLCTAISIIGFLSLRFSHSFTKKCIKILFKKFPFIKSIYKTTQECCSLANTESTWLKSSALIAATWSKNTKQYGFIINSTAPEIQRKLPEHSLCLFLPRTPNPYQGSLVFVDKTALLNLNQDSKKTLKSVISAGLSEQSD